MTFTIRSSTPSDRPAIIGLVREAFTSPGRDGQEEVNIVQNTWNLGAGVEGLELVAVVADAVVGHVLGAWGDLSRHEVMGVAPLCVAPARQREGVGTALMDELLRRADAQGSPLVVVLGDPAYYGRFGFEPSGPLRIVYPPVGANDPHFQVRRLKAYDPSLQGEYTYCWERQSL